MDRTSEFNAEIKKFNPPIFTKPKKNKIVKYKEINSRIFKFKCYVQLIRKPFLNISFSVDSVDLDLPSPRIVFEMTGNQKNAFYIQLQTKIKEIQNEIKNTNCECRINNEIKESLNHQLNIVVELLKSLELQRISVRRMKSPTSTPITKQIETAQYPNEFVEAEEEMDQEFIQTLELENQKLIKDYQQSLNQIEQANQKIQEIVQMQQELNLHLNTQLETTKNIQMDAEIIETNISSGVGILKKTRDIFGGSRYWVFYFFIISSLLLLFIDYIL
ncbi:hypothetical protein HDV06_002756 [Boothiomyces sp. JEL0866]|nr:hypothetical protein HDV06_002756 [Boothiomyces sp. JEL0866]